MDVRENRSGYQRWTIQKFWEHGDYWESFGLLQLVIIVGKLDAD